MGASTQAGENGKRANVGVSLADVSSKASPRCLSTTAAVRGIAWRIALLRGGRNWALDTLAANGCFWRTPREHDHFRAALRSALRAARRFTRLRGEVCARGRHM